RVTTARDLGTILFALDRAALGSHDALVRTELTEREARVGLAWLLASEPRGDNLGLFRPWLPRVAMAQKNGWIHAARHTAAVIYARAGPKIVVLLTYRDPRLPRPVAAALGRRVLR